MKIRTFRGKNMAETLEQVKRRLGRDAVIISTRTVESGGLLGVGGRAFVEMTVAPGDGALPEPLRRSMISTQGQDSDRAEGAAEVVSRTKQSSDPNSSADLLAELAELKSLVGVLVRETRGERIAHAGGELFNTYRQLVQNAVAEELAQNLIEKLRSELTPAELCDPAAVCAKLARSIEVMLPDAGPIDLIRNGAPTVVALVGPTGVGKTTTIAKLAANFTLRRNRSVGLITIDTYRIAAVEQLRTYARIINVPLEVVMSPSELSDAVYRLRDCDLILIDTAGRSQRDADKIKELHQFFRVVPPDEVHLVLSGSTGQHVMLEAVRRFSPLGVNRVIVTKLDEAVGFGVLLTALQAANARLSYVTTGQNVPDDIRVGDRTMLARLILAGRPENASAQSDNEQFANKR